MFPGIGTLVNVAAILVGAGLGLVVGQRMPGRIRDVVIDALGLAVLLIAALSAAAVTEAAFRDAVGTSGPVLIVLGAVTLGGIAGAMLRIEHRFEGLGGWLQRRLTSGSAGPGRQRFIEGFVTSSLVFCVGPLTILGSLSDGLGRGADQLFLKSVLDGFAAMAFAASFGVGVMASALAVGLVQGLLTGLGAVLGSSVPEPHLLAVTATGGLLLVGVAIRLLQLKPIPVGDLLPALLVAPLLTQLVIMIR